MPPRTHGKQAQHEQEQQAALETKREHAAELQKRERGPVKEVGHAVGQQERLGEVVKEALRGAKGLREEAGQTLREMKRAATEEDRRRESSFQPAGPGGAELAARGDLRRTQEEALARSQASERREQIDKVEQSVLKAAESVAYAAQSMLARHQATESELRAELQAMLAAAESERSQGHLAASERLARKQQQEAEVRAQLGSLMARQFDDAERLTNFLSEMREASRAVLRDVQEGLGERAGGTHEQRMEQTKDRLKQFDEQRDLVVAYRNLWDGRFSDIESVKKTWERASKKLDNTAGHFAKARENFWGLVNKPDDEHSRQVQRLLDKARVDWQGGTRAPLLAAEAKVLDELKKRAERGDDQARKWLEEDQRARRITIDHVADKSTNPALTLDPSNLRFMTNFENSARGNRFDTSEKKKLDVSHDDDWKAQNAKRADARGEKRVERSHGKLDAKMFALEEWSLQEKQHRMLAEHGKHLDASVQRAAEKERELLGSKLMLAEAETEGARNARRQELLKALHRFEDAASEQAKGLLAFERRLHEQQSQELARARQDITGDWSPQRIHERAQSLEQGRAEEQRKVNALWEEMKQVWNDAQGRMLQAIHSATTREAQEQRIKHAFEKQQEAADLQRRRVEELERERSARA